MSITSEQKQIINLLQKEMTEIAAKIHRYEHLKRQIPNIQTQLDSEKIKNTTLKIAKLCRIRVNDEDIKELSAELSSILDWVEQLNEVNTDNIEPLSNVSSSELPLRKDEENSDDNSKEILSNAPEKIENYFVVPKVVE